MVTGLLFSSPSWGSRLYAQEVTAEISYQAFYDDLSPYGHWIVYPGYGYVWCPAVSLGFRPYVTSGHWVWTDEGWCWVSDYPWGWAAFHYGRWFYDTGYGWLWLPGYEWSPAWVAWRSGAGCYGWAPISPGFSFSVGFALYDPPLNYWCFAPQRYIVSPYVGRFYVNAAQNVTFVHQTTIINNYSYTNHVYRAGPPISEVQRVTDRPVNAVAVRAAGRPGPASSGQAGLSLYRPVVNAGTGVTASPHSVAHFRGSPRPLLPSGESRHPDEYARQYTAASTRPLHSASAARGTAATRSAPPSPSNRTGPAPAGRTNPGNARPDVVHGSRQPAPSRSAPAPAHNSNPGYNPNRSVTHSPAPTHAPAPTHRGPSGYPGHPATVMHRQSPPRTMPAQHPPTVMHRSAAPRQAPAPHYGPPQRPATVMHPAPAPHPAPPRRAGPEHRVS